MIAGPRGPRIVRALRMWLAIAALALGAAAAYARTPSPAASGHAPHPANARPGDGC